MTSISPTPRSGIVPDGAGPGRAEVQGLQSPGFAATLDAVADAANRARRFDGTMVRTSAERFNEDGFFAEAAATAQGPALDGGIDLDGKEGVAVAEPLAPQASPVAPAPTVRPGPMDADVPAPAASSGVPSPAPEGRSGPVRGAVRAAGPPRANVAPLLAERRLGDRAIDAGETRTASAAPRAARAVSPGRFQEQEGAGSAVSVMLNAAEGIVAVTGAHQLTESEARALRADIAALLRRHGLVLDDLRLDGRSTAGGRNDPREG